LKPIAVAPVARQNSFSPFPSDVGTCEEIVTRKMIGQTVSHYHILSLLGEGGMGMVYAAEDMHLGRKVAIKFLHTTSNDHHYRARFLREARAISSLSHPHIATVYDYGETDDGQPFLVMELIDGDTLGELLEASALSLWEAVEIIEYVADALDEAHHRGIVHRDIKPSNVIVTDRGQVKVLDFGLAKRMIEESHEQTDQNAKTLLATRTREGIVVGTPLYLSPEQATGGTVDGRSDLFALGALLYECITGKPAFSGSSVIEIGAQVLHINPPPPSDINPQVPAELDRITLKALSKKTIDRYQLAAEMRDDLAAVRASLSSGGEKIRRVKQARKGSLPKSALTTISTSLRQPRISVFTLVLGVLAIGAVIAGMFLMFRPKRHAPLAEAQTYYNIGTNFLREGAYHQASKALEKAISIDPEFALAHARLGEAYYELDYGEKSKEELLRANALVPDRSVLDDIDSRYLEAINAVAVNNNARAVELYKEIVELAPDQPQVLVDLGRAYEKNEEGSKAGESYLAATRTGQEYAPAFLRAAIIYIRKLEIPTATATLDRAESIYGAQGNIEGRTEVLYWRGVMQTESGQLPAARASLQKAIGLTDSLGNEPQKIKVLLQLSRLSYKEGSAAKAQDYANEAFLFAEQRGLSNLAILALLDLGNAFSVAGDYAKADDPFRRALLLAQRNGARRSEALAKLNLGGNLMQQLRDDEGLPLVVEAMEFFKQGNYQKQFLQSLTYVGRANRRKGDFATALQVFEERRDFATKRDVKSQVAYSHGEIGTVLSKQERFPEALRSYDQSYDILNGLGEEQSIAYNRMNRAGVLLQLGNHSEAQISLDYAFSLADKPADSYKQVLAEIEMIRAQMMLSLRRFPEAKTHALLAIEKAGTEYLDVAIGAKIVLGSAQAFLGGAKEGRRTCEEALALAERSGDQPLIGDAMLALSEALYQSGDFAGSLSRALEAQSRIARSGEQESEWRAWRIAGMATLRLNDKRAASERLSFAKSALDKLMQQWGADFPTYQLRPDIQFFHKQLSEALTAAQQ
jgi:serine/threonine protein kinase/Tfp pilus assembly protein PilF